MSSKESGHLDQTLRISATKMLQLKKYTASLSWLLSLLVLCFVVFFLAPRRGADLFEDEGWFLVNAWSAAQGGNPDLLMPQAAHYLVNALLMKLGTTGILPLKQLFLLGIYVASCGLFLSLTPLRWQSPIVPMAICPPLLVNLNQIFNHYTSSIYFTMAGLAILLLSRTASVTYGNISASAAGILLAVATLFNIVIGIGIACVAVLILMANATPYRAAFFRAFLISTLCFWTLYLAWLGPGNILVKPVAHDPQAFELARRALDIVLFHLQALAILACLAAICMSRGLSLRSATSLSVAGLTSAALLWFFVCHISYLADFHFNLWPPFRYLRILSLDFHHPTRMGAAAAFILTINIAALCVLDWASGAISFGLRRSWTHHTDRLSWPPAWLPLPILEGRDEPPLVIVAGIALFTITAFGCMASNTHIFVGMTWTAGASLGLSMLISGRLDIPRIWVAFNCLMAVIFCLLFAVSYNHATNRSIFSPLHATAQHGKLSGILLPSSQSTFLQEFTELYDANGCANSTFVIDEYMPLLYYVLGKLPPDARLRAVRPAYYFPSELILKAISGSEKWCVLHGTSFETESFARGKPDDPRKAVTAFLERNGKQKYAITSPGGHIRDVTLYVGNAK